MKGLHGAVSALAILVLLCGAAEAATRQNLDFTSYAGANQAERIATAQRCMTALRARLLTPAPNATRAGGRPGRPGGANRPPRGGAPFADPGTRANCLRYSFHDCGTFDVTGPDTTPPGGCNGQLRTTIAAMVAAGTYNTPAAQFPVDNGLDACQRTLFGLDGTGGACNAVRAAEPGCASMPYADCASFAGALAVALSGGAPSGGCGWVPGRVDQTGNQAANLLPSEFNNATALIATFTKYGMDLTLAGGTIERTVAVLMGAHTIGRTRQTPTSLCSKGLRPMTRTSATFDTEYYTAALASTNTPQRDGAWFCSDLAGICSAVTYATGPGTRVGQRPPGQGQGPPQGGQQQQPPPQGGQQQQPPPQGGGGGQQQGGVRPPGQGGPNGAVTLRRGSCGGRMDSPMYPHFAALAGGGNANFFEAFCSAYSAMSLIGYATPGDYAAIAANFKGLLLP